MKTRDVRSQVLSKSREDAVKGQEVLKLDPHHLILLIKASLAWLQAQKKLNRKQKLYSSVDGKYSKTSQGDAPGEALQVPLSQSSANADPLMAANGVNHENFAAAFNSSDVLPQMMVIEVCDGPVQSEFITATSPESEDEPEDEPDDDGSNHNPDLFTDQPLDLMEAVVGDAKAPMEDLAPGIPYGAEHRHERQPESDNGSESGSESGSGSEPEPMSILPHG